MAKLDGFFTLHRKLFEDVLWLSGTPIQKNLMVLCIGKAGFKQKEWFWEGKKFNAERGQFITSLDSLKKELGKGATLQKIRTSLDNLEKYGFLANKSTKTGRLITIVNYSKYQDKKEKVTKKATKNQQRGNKEVTPTNNDNNGNNDNNNISMRTLKLWNSKKIIVHKISNELLESIEKIIKKKKFKEDNIKQSIENYSIVRNDKNYFFKYTWSLENFLSRKKVLPSFLDGGENWENYKQQNKDSELKKKIDWDKFMKDKGEDEDVK